MLTWGMFLGGFLATEVAIEFNSDSVASNKSPGVANPWLKRYRMVWALKPQSARASSMVIDRLSEGFGNQKCRLEKRMKSQRWDNKCFQNLCGNGYGIVASIINHVTCQVFEKNRLKPMILLAGITYIDFRLVILCSGLLGHWRSSPTSQMTRINQISTILLNIGFIILTMMNRSVAVLLSRTTGWRHSYRWAVGSDKLLNLSDD